MNSLIVIKLKELITSLWQCRWYNIADNQSFTIQYFITKLNSVTYGSSEYCDLLLSMA